MSKAGDALKQKFHQQKVSKQEYQTSSRAKSDQLQNLIVEIYTHKQIKQGERERTSAVELDGGLQLDDSGGVALGDGGVELLEGFVVVSDVSLVVFLVMNLHDFSTDANGSRAP